MRNRSSVSVGSEAGERRSTTIGIQTGTGNQLQAPTIEQLLASNGIRVPSAVLGSQLPTFYGRMSEDQPIVDDDDDEDDDDDVIDSDDVQCGSNDDDTADCITYHEVTLRRASGDDRVGLTLCYKDSEDGATTHVIVGEIDPSGEAARCGRIHEGDQIVKINGTEVRSRDQVLRLFASNASSVNLLLARHHVITQIDDGLDLGEDEINRNTIFETPSRSYRFCSSRLPNFMSSVRLLECIDEEDDLTDGTCPRELEADSGISRTDESVRNDESSEQELNDTDSNSPSGSARSVNGGESPRVRLDVDAGVTTTTRSPCSSFSPSAVTPKHRSVCPASALSSKFREFYISLDDDDDTAAGRSSSATVDGRTGCSSTPPKLPRKPPLPPRREPGVPRTVVAVDRVPPPPMFDVLDRVRPDDPRQAAGAPGAVPDRIDTRAVRRVPRMGTRLNVASVPPAIADQSPQRRPCVDDVWNDSPGRMSCGVDTGTMTGNCPVTVGRTPLTLQIRHPFLDDPDFSASSPSPPPPPPFGLAMLALTPPPPPPASKAALRRGDYVSRSTQTDSRAEAYRLCADVMYTNRANLLHTIAVQQRLFRQQLADGLLQSPPGGGGAVRQSSSTDGGEATPPRRRPTPTDDGDTDEAQKQLQNRSEWVVRKRSDGTRYVTRRPVRSRAIVHHHPVPVVQPGFVGVAGGETTTTDDDEAEQPKTGRYWTREQRRQHVAERRERAAMKQLRAATAAAAMAAMCSTGEPLLHRGRVRRALVVDAAATAGSKRKDSGGRGHQNQLLSVATV